ncbi:MAG TPA: hypothetical protein PK955_01820 [Methanoregulaceae archaeon]|nr:hypothetical protein [Methanoregulaceae archaeon]
MDDTDQITRVVEVLAKQIQALAVQTAAMNTSLEHSTKEIRRCLDHHDDRIADHEARLRDVEKDSPWMKEIEGLRNELSGLYASVNDLEACRDKGIGGKEYLAYLVGLGGGIVGIYSIFVK